MNHYRYNNLKHIIIDMHPELKNAKHIDLVDKECWMHVTENHSSGEETLMEAILKTGVYAPLGSPFHDLLNDGYWEIGHGEFIILYRNDILRELDLLNKLKMGTIPGNDW